MMFVDALKKLRAGDPDQPRDDDGKWTDGGGGGGGDAAKAPAKEHSPQVKKAQRALDRTNKKAQAHAAKVVELDRLIVEKRDTWITAQDNETTAFATFEEAESAREEAEEHATALSEPDEDDPSRVVTEEEKEASVAAAREAKLAEDKAKKEHKAAERAEKKAERDFDRTNEKAEEAEERYQEALGEHSVAEDEADLAEIQELDADEQDAKVGEKLEEAERLEVRAKEKHKIVLEKHQETVSELDRRSKEIWAKHDADQKEATRIIREGTGLPEGQDDPWEYGMSLSEKAKNDAVAAQWKIDREKATSEKSLLRASSAALRAEDSKLFWEDVSGGTGSSLSEDDDAEGTASDRDGDGLTGEEEEQDDDDE
jgi:hypothetical protein